MKRINIYSLITLITIFSSCKKIDNYASPNGDIYGKVIDNITKEGLQTEEPLGFTLQLFEKGGSMNSPISFDGKPDGTYENANVFQGEYKVIPTQGAFFPVIDTTDIKIGGRTEVNFTVTPFLAVTNVSVQPGAGEITTSYNIVRSQIGDKISERETLISKIPTVSNVVFDFELVSDLTTVSDNDILSNQFTDTITNLTSGIYYVRIAVRTSNALNKFNYSKVFEVTVP